MKMRELSPANEETFNLAEYAEQYDTFMSKMQTTLTEDFEGVKFNESLFQIAHDKVSAILDDQVYQIHMTFSFDDVDL